MQQTEINYLLPWLCCTWQDINDDMHHCVEVEVEVEVDVQCTIYVHRSTA